MQRFDEINYCANQVFICEFVCIVQCITHENWQRITIIHPPPPPKSHVENQEWVAVFLLISLQSGKEEKLYWE